MNRFGQYLFPAAAAIFVGSSLLWLIGMSAEPNTKAPIPDEVTRWGSAGQTTAPAMPEAKPTEDPAKPKSVLAAAREEGGVSRRQLRKMGITHRKLRPVLWEMYKAGELEDKTLPQIREVLQYRLLDENPKAFADPSLDWDAIEEAFERIIRMILRLIELWELFGL